METNSKTAPIVQEKDKNSISLDLMHRMKMHGMAAAFQESIQSTVAESMTPDGFLSWLLAREWDYRANAAIERLIKGAAFRYKAYLEEIDYGVSRGLDLGPDGKACLTRLHQRGAESVHHRPVRDWQEFHCNGSRISGVQGKHQDTLF